MNILITGVDGFLGRHIARGLLADGHRIFGISNGTAPNLGIGFMPVDIADRAAVMDAAKRAEADLCIHLAALAHADVGTDRVPLVRQVNVGGSMHLLDALEAAGTQELIYFSSVKVLGETTPPEGIDEDSPPVPSGVYAESKLEVEREISKRTAAGTLRGVIVRPAAVVGRDDTKGNYAKMARLIRRGFFPVLGGGTARRSLVFVDTLVHRIRTMVTEGLRPGECYVFSDGDWSIREIVDAMRTASGFAYCPTVPLGGWMTPLRLVDVLSHRLHPGRRPVADLLRRLTDSFVVHPHRWAEAYGEMPSVNLTQAMTQVFGERASLSQHRPCCRHSSHP